MDKKDVSHNDYDSLLSQYNDLKKASNYRRVTGLKAIERMRYDFNTLLNSTTGYMYSLLENADSSSKHQIEGALKTNRVLMNKFNDLSEYIAMTMSEYEQKLEPTSIRIIVRQINQEYDEDLGVKGLLFIYDIDDNVPEYIETDYSAVKKAVSKLVENAIQNTFRGSIKIECTLVSETKEEVVVKFSVIDEGNGIDSEKIDEILSGEGYKEDLKNIASGGLGLLMARDFLSLVGSEITAVNNEDKGATLSFVLKANKIDSEIDADEDDFIEIDLKKALSGVKVLLTDDSVIMQQIVKQMLEEEGAAVTVCVNGQEAVESFGGGRYDILLMDVEMPVLNGYEASKQISEMKEQRSIKTPIVAMTAHTDQSEYDKCLESGMSSVLLKPFKRAGLLSAIYMELYDKEYVEAEQAQQLESGSSIYKFDKIKGIDYKEGLSRLSGNGKVYFELLQNFRDGYGGSVETITRLLKEGNDNEVKNLLHLIKGISGNLSFTDIYDYASRLRDAVDSDNVPEISADLEGLDKAVEEFKQTFGAAEVEILYNMSEMLDMDMMMVKTRLNDLMTSLSGDVDLGNAMDACDDVYDYMKETEYKKDFGRIKDAMNSFDLELAQSLLTKFMEQFS